MQTKEYRTTDKSEWGPGPWLDEPDKMQWPDPATGLPCLIVRNTHVTGSLCGYVGVPDTHPWHGKDYNDLPDYGPDVHGGLTFAAPCTETDDETSHICHVPDPGEPDNVWWFGFDCGHSGDLSPAMEARHRSSPFGATVYGGGYRETYKTIAYVREEVTKLAAQIAAASVPRTGPSHE